MHDWFDWWFAPAEKVDNSKAVERYRPKQPIVWHLVSMPSLYHYWTQYDTSYHMMMDFLETCPTHWIQNDTLDSTIPHSKSSVNAIDNKRGSSAFAPFLKLLYTKEAVWSLATAATVILLI